MINVNNIALIYAFDIPHYVKLENDIKEYRFYDEEFLKSVKFWRKNAGWLKDIHIYALTFGDIEKYNPEIINQLKDFDVTIFNTLLDFPNDAWKKCVYAGKFFESKLSENILIRLDLDMYCLKELPIEWFKSAEDNNVLVGQYDKRNNLETRQIYYNGTAFDISLIISNKQTHFYEKYYQCYTDEKTYDTDEWRSYIERQSKYFSGYVGEYVIDYMSNRKIIQITPITNHHFGEGYRSISLYTNEEAKKICFLHEHIRKKTQYYDNYDPVKSMITYLSKIK